MLHSKTLPLEGRSYKDAEHCTAYSLPMQKGKRLGMERVHIEIFNHVRLETMQIGALRRAMQIGATMQIGAQQVAT